MIIVLLIAAGLVISCVSFHGFAIQVIARKLCFGEVCFSFYRVGILILAAMVAHIVEIVLFELAYVLLAANPEYGVIAGERELAATDYFYFSAATYTTTGYGDLVPTGNLRVLATIEALTGMIMITWTASFAFLVMQQYWRDQFTTLQADERSIRS